MIDDATREQIIAEARAEKGGYLRGKGWTEEQIVAYLAGVRWTGWRPRMDFYGRAYAA
jgi:hypothetical protein